MENRDIPIIEFIEVLEREYISAYIRKKIFPRKKDKSYWSKVMNGKKDKIENLCSKNSLSSIFNNSQREIEIWRRIVPQYGMPSLFINKHMIDRYNKSKKKFFPYAHMVLRLKKEAGLDFSLCIVDKFDFENQSIFIKERDDSKELFNVKIGHVEVIHPKELDMAYYYYPGSEFKVCDEDNSSSFSIYTLDSFDFQNQSCNFKEKDGILLEDVPIDEVSRIL